MLFVVAVLVNYTWERLQSPLYVHPGRASIPWWLCLAASLADGLFVLVIFGVGWIVLGRRTWFEQPGIEGYLVMLTSGVAISVGVEWTTIHVLRWWTYGEHMPLVPIVNIGLAPMIQMLVLPPLIFRGVAVVSRYVDGMRGTKACGQ
ncbi:MAG: hypothetical protein OJF52_001797 [Nitrospira sp.]|jgi:hypothetical protein|nr:MAG: hypothetical protein OJF52_001797 [Nitrospira sp.]